MIIRLNELLYELSFALDCVEHELIGSASHHSKRVALLCLEMGRLFGMDDVQLSDLASCASLHDNALTEYILSERMNGNDLLVSERDEHRLNLKSHCILGEKNAQDFPFQHDTSGFILYHHENADGSGCFGKRRGEIPLEAALIRLADNLDVKFNLRCLSMDKIDRTRVHVMKNSGKLYDPAAAEAFADLNWKDILPALCDGRLDEELIGRTPSVTADCPNEQLLRVASVFAKIVDYKSPFTKRHSSGIAFKSYTMANLYGFSEDEADRLTLAAALHDVGKLTVPTRLLEKPGKLMPEEYWEVQQHVVYTHKILGGISGFETINRWASSHHEKLDGSGYPFAKTEEQLDFNCRLLACIDIYQALTEDRPYRAGMSHADAMNILRDMALRRQLDGGIVEDLDQAALKEGVPQFV